jgi:hypothetical protein
MPGRRPKKPMKIGLELTAAIERGKEVLARDPEVERSAAASEFAKQIVADLSPEAKDRAAWVTISRFLLSD